MSRVDSRTFSVLAGRGRIGFGRRGRAAAIPPGTAGWRCPGCRLTVQDPVDLRFGFCGKCGDFTGMCGAGRRVVSPDVMSVTSWHLPCTRLGATSWQLTLDSGVVTALLCAEHDGQVRSGRASWIAAAAPVA